MGIFLRNQVKGSALEKGKMLFKGGPKFSFQGLTLKCFPENEKLHRSRSVQWISITRDGPLSLTVRPIHRKNGGRGQSLHEEDVTVTLPCSGEDFIRGELRGRPLKVESYYQKEK